MKAFFVVCCVALAACSIASAQEPQRVQVQRTITSESSDAKSPALTKEQKQYVQQLLESAEAGTAALDAVSRVVSYSQLAHAYQVTNKQKAIALLESALSSSSDLQFDSADRRLNDSIKQQLQERVVRDLATLAPERLDQLMDELTPELRARAVDPMVAYYGKSNRLDRATQVVMQVAQEGEMPYGSASALMSLLGREHPDDVRSLFLAAMTSYQNHDHPGFQSHNDFPDMVAKFQEQLPPAILQQAIDVVLSAAQKTDEKFDGMSVSIASGNGAASFQSAYDYRLFQLISAIRRIDPERADKLMRDRQDVNTLVAKYPNGMSSLDSSKGGMSMTIGIGSRQNGAPAPPGLAVLERQKVAQIMDDAGKHPQDALANAATLSPASGIEAYLAIARASQKQSPSAARRSR